MTLIDLREIAGPLPGRGAAAGPVADEARLEALYRDHAPAVLRFALRRTEASAADDVVAETFLVAWRRRDEVPADALPWLYAVAGNVLRTHHRSARRLVSLRERIAAEPGAALPWATVDPGHVAQADTATDHTLLRALATLRPIDREAILLTAWEDLSAERAAAAAGCSPATFHVRLHRARARLAKALERTTTTGREEHP